MRISLELGSWVSHSNMLLSAATYHAWRTGIDLSITCRTEAEIPRATFLLEAGGRRMFLDYNDRFERVDAAPRVDVYAKRSIRLDDTSGLFPLGFQFNYAFRLHRLLVRPGFLTRGNRVEIVRALDLMGTTTWSHAPRRIEHLFAPRHDNGGRALFYVRLWDPGRNADPEEQERRRKMNTVRVEAVRALRRMENTAAGILPDEYAQKICPDLLLSVEQTKTRNYMRELRKADIGIANEGLRGSPGWKIGEYVAGAKAVVTNKIESVVPDFVEGRNYVEFEDASVLPDLVADLRRSRRYAEIQVANERYSQAFLHPDRYFARILERLAQ